MRTWSFSSLNTYYNCPRQYYLQYVSGVIKYKETEATLYGSRVHKALEEYGRDGKELPADCKPFAKYVDKILSLDGTPFFERQYAITSSFKPCDFNDKSAWCRGVVDIGVIGKAKAFLGDYKTGKMRIESDQLKLFAGFAMVHHPVDSVKTAYIWLKPGKITAIRYARDELPKIWEHFTTKVRKLEQSYEKDKWIPRPSGLCAWCGAGLEYCEFWLPRS